MASGFRILALSSVFFVLAIPGFTQTNTGAERTLRSSQSVARVYVAARGHAYDNAEVAPNLTVPPVYQRTIDLMRRRSQTFRRQVARLANDPLLTVVIESDPPPGGHVALAWTNISRDRNGHMTAMIRIGAPARLVELIAHEFEHVIEQLDGVDLAHKARLRSSGVRHCDCGNLEAFETTRAIATGLRVASEVEGRNP